MAGDPVGKRRPAAMRRPARIYVGFAVVAAVLTAVAVFVGLTSWRSSSGDRLPSDEWVVYWNDNPWPSIWAVRPDGSDKHRILPNEQNAKRPRLSPDREWVAFDGAPPGERVLSDFDIQIIRLDGSGLRTLTDTPDWDTDAQWSPDGGQIAFTRSPPSPQDSRDASVWVMQADGGQAHRILSGARARWSPDGRTLVYGSRDGRDLMLADADGSSPRLLLRGPEDRKQLPAGWSPDGKSILFTRQAGQTFSEVFVIGADGGNERKLGSGFAACWSPSGEEILFTTAFGSRLQVMNADGSDRRELSAAAGSEPDWR